MHREARDCPASITPAFSEARTIPRAGNMPRLPRRWSCPIRSNAPARSASRIHWRWLRLPHSVLFTPTEEGTLQGGVVTPPTQWITGAHVTLRVGAVVVAAAAGGLFPD